MSYDKMMKFQRTSIRKQKRRSYSANVICSIPSDADCTGFKMSSDITDYPGLKDDLSPAQYRIAEYFMHEYGLKGIPCFVELSDNIKRDFLYHTTEFEGKTYHVRQFSFGFSIACLMFNPEGSPATIQNAMSHEHIKKIKIADDRVWVEYKCDITDDRYDVREVVSLSEILKNEGLRAVEKEILMLYFSESWQDNLTKYSRAVNRAVILYGIDKYEAWEKGWTNPLYRDSLKELFYETLHTRIKTQKCCLESEWGRLKTVTKKGVLVNNTHYRIFSNPVAAKIYRGQKDLSDTQFVIRLLSAEEVSTFGKIPPSKLL